VEVAKLVVAFVVTEGGAVGADVTPTFDASIDGVAIDVFAV
jgi:hypothetical protein